jgi:hypothetical protein
MVNEERGVEEEEEEEADSRPQTCARLLWLGPTIFLQLDCFVTIDDLSTCLKPIRLE